MIQVINPLKLLQIPNVPNILGPLIFAILAFLLIFAGKTVVKAVIFIVTGFIASGFAVMLTQLYGINLPLTVILVLAMFIIGGLVGLFLLPLGIGLSLGVIGYSIASTLQSSFIIALLIGMIMFVLGVTLAEKIIIALSAVLGAFILITAAIELGIPLPISILGAIILAAIGIVIQIREGRG